MADVITWRLQAQLEAEREAAAEREAGWRQEAALLAARASAGAAAGGGARTSEGVRHVDAPLVHLAQQNPDHPPLASLGVHSEEVVHGRKQHERVHDDVPRVERVRQHLLRHAGPRGQPILRAPSGV